MRLSVAAGVGRRAIVGSLDDDGLALSSKLPALAAAWGHPVSASEGLRNCGTTIEESSVWVAGWGLEKGVGVAVDLFTRAAKATSASTTTAVPVASGRGPAGVSLVGDEGENCCDLGFHVFLFLCVIFNYY